MGGCITEMDLTIRCPLVFVILSSIARCAKRVQFADMKLETAVSRAIGKGEGAILESDLEGLTELSVYTPYPITDLSGIEHCTKLQKLDLNGNNLSDLSPLSSLTNLQELHLENNPITDISPLSSLTNLKMLDKRIFCKCN